MIDAIYNGGLGLIAAAWWTGTAWPVHLDPDQDRRACWRR